MNELEMRVGGSDILQKSPLLDMHLIFFFHSSRLSEGYVGSFKDFCVY
jgi:hypothetical protein